MVFELIVDCPSCWPVRFVEPLHAVRYPFRIVGFVIVEAVFATTAFADVIRHPEFGNCGIGIFTRSPAAERAMPNVPVGMIRE